MGLTACVEDTFELASKLAIMLVDFLESAIEQRANCFECRK
jgi:hypothetical protein